jgi:hypothetical protein
MDPDTVIALGSLVHDLLGLVGGIILCYFGYRLMIRRIKAYPADRKWSWVAAKIMLKATAPGTMFALLGAIQIWLIAAKGPHSDGSRAFSDSYAVASKSGEEHPPASASEVDRLGTPEGSRRLFPETPVDAATASGEEATDALSVSIGSKIAPRTKADVFAAVAAKPPKTRQQEANLDAMRRIGRRSLEKQRLAAEKKRSRLEAMYQKGTISSQAYRNGENEYRIAIQRYRNEVNASAVDEN